MEYLDMNFADEVKQDGLSKENIDAILTLIDAGIATKDPLDIEELVGKLSKPTQEYLGGIMKAKSDGQDKAIISALVERYPKLDSDNGEQKEFKQHVQNMIQSNNLKDGTAKKLIEIIVLKQSDSNNNKKKETPEQPEQPEAEQPEQAAETSQDGETGDSQETNNSDMELGNDSFYANWETDLNEDLDLTEDDYAEMLGDNIEELISGTTEIINSEPSVSHLRSSEDRKEVEKKLIERRKSMSSNSNYAGVDLAIKFLVEKERQYSEIRGREFLESSESIKLAGESKEAAVDFVRRKLGIKELKSRNYSSNPKLGSMIKSKKKKSDLDNNTDNGEYFSTDIRGNLTKKHLHITNAVAKQV